MDKRTDKKIALLIDADNTQYSKLNLILKELSKHGYLITKKAYGDWSDEKLKNWKTVLNELAIQPVQQFSYTVGKNSSDIALVIDAMDLLYSERFDSFAIVSSDSDFTRLASRLRESSMFIFGVGKRTTPKSFKNACDDFIIIENLNDEVESENDSKDSKPKMPNAKLKEVVSILKEAWENNSLEDDEQWAYVSQSGSYIKKTYSDFDSRTYGAKSYTKLIQNLSEYFEIRKNKKGHYVFRYKMEL